MGQPRKWKMPPGLTRGEQMKWVDGVLNELIAERLMTLWQKIERELAEGGDLAFAHADGGITTRNPLVIVERQAQIEAAWKSQTLAEIARW